MKIKNIEHSDEFDNELVVYFELQDMEDEFVSQGKQIDSEEYSENCFGICAIYDADNGSLNIIEEGMGSTNVVYYIDNAGDKHYLKGEFDRNLLNEMLDLAKAELELYSK